MSGHGTADNRNDHSRGRVPVASWVQRMRCVARSACVRRVRVSSTRTCAHERALVLRVCSHTSAWPLSQALPFSVSACLCAWTRGITLMCARALHTHSDTYARDGHVCASVCVVSAFHRPSRDRRPQHTHTHTHTHTRTHTHTHSTHTPITLHMPSFHAFDAVASSCTGSTCVDSERSYEHVWVIRRDSSLPFLLTTLGYRGVWESDAQTCSLSDDVMACADLVARAGVGCRMRDNRMHAAVIASLPSSLVARQ